MTSGWWPYPGLKSGRQHFWQPNKWNTAKLVKCGFRGGPMQTREFPATLLRIPTNPCKRCLKKLEEQHER